MRQRIGVGDDEGITMIEVVVAMLVFGVFSAFAVGLQVDLSGRTRDGAQRLVATNLATRHLEILRSATALSIPDGRSPVADQPLVNGTRYTLVQDVRFVAGPDGGSVCAGTAEALAYKLVTVEVTWPGMGTTRPVRVDSLKTVGIGKSAADVTRGSLAVRVTTNAGLPQSGVRVTLTPSGAVGTTGADGCLVFPNLPTTVTHTATVDQAPMVGLASTQAVSRSTTVQAGKVARSSFVYERRGGLSVVTPAPAGYPLPSGLPVTVESSIPTSPTVFPECGAGGLSGCVSGTPRTAAALFPATYTGWPGTCARPAGLTGVAVSSDQTAATTTTLGGLQVLLRAGDPLAVGDVYAFRPVRSGCTGTESYKLTAPSPSERRLALVPGTWQLATRADGSDAATVAVTVTVGAGTVATVQR